MAPVGDFAKVMAALPGKVSQLVARTGCSESTVRRHLRRARASDQAHISGWERTIAASTPIHSPGVGINIPRPPARGNAAWVRSYKRRIRREQAKQMAERALALQQIVLPKTKQSPFSALGL